MTYGDRPKFVQSLIVLSKFRKVRLAIAIINARKSLEEIAKYASTPNVETAAENRANAGAQHRAARVAVNH